MRRAPLPRHPHHSRSCFVQLTYLVQPSPPPVPLQLTFTMPWSATTAFNHPLVQIKSTNAPPGLTNYLSFSLADVFTWQGCVRARRRRLAPRAPVRLTPAPLIPCGRLADITNTFRTTTLGLAPLSLRSGPSVTDRLKVRFPRTSNARRAVLRLLTPSLSTPARGPGALDVLLEPGPDPQARRLEEHDRHLVLLLSRPRERVRAARRPGRVPRRGRAADLHWVRPASPRIPPVRTRSTS